MTIGTRFDDITIEVRPDYLAPGRPVREMHIYRQNDGRELKCKGLGWCRECNREAPAMLTISPPCAAWSKGKSE